MICKQRYMDQTVMQRKAQTVMQRKAYMKPNATKNVKLKLLRKKR